MLNVAALFALFVATRYQRPAVTASATLLPLLLPPIDHGVVPGAAAAAGAVCAGCVAAGKSLRAATNVRLFEGAPAASVVTTFKVVAFGGTSMNTCSSDSPGST